MIDSIIEQEIKNTFKDKTERKLALALFKTNGKKSEMDEIMSKFINGNEVKNGNEHP